MAKTSENNMWTIAHFKGGDIKLVPNDLVVVDYIDQEMGSSIEINNSKLAFVDGKIVTDKKILNNIIVTGTIVKQHRGPKLVVFKYRRRKNSCRKNGHRQDLTTLKVESIVIK
jgi:large subunit ribosomal protein L21